jgi:hypothetical protein
VSTESIPEFKNPFRPGAGHMPPYLAGRQEETDEFRRLLRQDVVLENMVLTGLRGVGKTVLLDTWKPEAIEKEWLWVGTDLSEASSVTEEAITIRLLTDLSVVTSSIVFDRTRQNLPGFGQETRELTTNLDFSTLVALYGATPGLVADKLKSVLKIVWNCMQENPPHGIVFAYDEAQNLSDHSAKEQYPTALLLDVFQSIQKMEIPLLLILTGLPTLFPKLVEARTFSERMFRVVFLDRLSDEESREAIIKPITANKYPVKFDPESVELIVRNSGGYPYFIQFICREAYDAFIQKVGAGEQPAVPMESIIRKLDTDFFAGRWGRVTDRQRDLLLVIARLPNADAEFTVQEVVEASKEILEKPFSGSHANQMLSALGDAGLVYKNRHGKYSFAVPLLGPFILRQYQA